MQLEIRTMPLDELKPAPYNPRRALKPGDSAYEKLAASVREFGLVEPLIWNEITGHIVGGHLRLQILRQLGIESVPVSVVRLSLPREKSLNVVLNNREAQSTFDPQKLAQLLRELSDLPELPLTGFDAGDLKSLQFQPVEELPSEPPAAEVEVTLTMSPECYEAAAPRVEALVRDFDLRCHVRR